MRLAPFALLALLALPACAPYPYGYATPYGTPVYGGPAPAYGTPYYPPPAYVGPEAGGVVLFGGGDHDDRRRYDNRPGNYQQGRPQPGPIRGNAPPPRPASVFAGPQRSGGGGAQVGPPGNRHERDYNPANPTAQGGGDR